MINILFILYHINVHKRQRANSNTFKSPNMWGLTAVTHISWGNDMQGFDVAMPYTDGPRLVKIPIRKFVLRYCMSTRLDHMMFTESTVCMITGYQVHTAVKKSCLNERSDRLWRKARWRSAVMYMHVHRQQIQQEPRGR